MRIELVARMKKAQNWSMNSPSGWAGFSCAYIEIFGDWNTFPLENYQEISKEDILHLL